MNKLFKKDKEKIYKALLKKRDKEIHLMKKKVKSIERNYNELSNENTSLKEENVFYREQVNVKDEQITELQNG